MKIVYCIAGTRHAGGMERVLANKANYLTTHGYEIIIVTTDQYGEKSFFDMDPRIRTVDLGINYEENNGKSFFNKLIHYPAKQKRHRRLLSSVLMEEKPDITVSMFCNDVSFLPKIKDGSKKVLEIHFSRFKRLQYGRKGLWRIADRWRNFLDRIYVSKFDRFIVLTEEDSKYWGNLHNMEVIPNARTFETDKCADMSCKTVIAVGRLTFQKGFERLIEVWKLIHPEFPDWNLKIVGNGEEKANLKALVQKYGIENSVTFIESSGSIEDHYISASIITLTSRYEGLPMVLLEAQAVGLPAVSFRCKCGPADILSDGKDGFLVKEGNIEEFTEKLRLLMSDTTLRKKMGKSALESSARFSEQRIMNRWIALFGSLANKSMK